jgi:hypothetical protein
MTDRGVPIRVGLRVAWYAGSVRREGIIRKLENGGTAALIEPDDATSETAWPIIGATDIRVPLSGGVFASDEKFEDWIVQFQAARAKFVAALASGALDRIDETDLIDVPDEIMKVIKQIIAVLGTEEAIRLLRALFGR